MFLVTSSRAKALRSELFGERIFEGEALNDYSN